PVAPCASRHPGRHVDDEDPPVLVVEFLDPYLPADLLIDARLRPPGLGEGGTDDLSRPAVSDAEDDLAPALIGHGNTVAQQFFEAEASAGLLELQFRAFRRREELLEFFGCHADTTSPFATSSWNPY